MFQGLSTALTALYASRQALEVTGNNIANVNTEGFSRQRLEQSAIGGLTSPSFWTMSNGVGQGVRVEDVTRLRDEFLEAQSLNEHAKQGSLNANHTAFERIQQAFAEPGETGLQNQLSEFWKTWDELAKNPGDSATRSLVIEQSQTLVTNMQQTSSSLSDLKVAALEKVKGDVSQINAWAQNIADLNTAIQASVNAGNTPNGLLDQRDQLISKMSGVVDVATQPTSAGSVAVTIGGVAIVRDNRVTNMEVDDTGSPVTLRWDTDNDPSTVTNGYAATVTGGDLGGQMNVLTTVVPKYQQLLDGVAQSVISTINTQHAAGLDLNGNPGGVYFTGTSASTIAVDPTLAANTSLIAAAGTSAGVGQHDAENARAMANLASSVNGPDSQYRQLIDVLGVEGQRALRQATIQQTITNSIDSSRQSVSGVNLDEEMTNMVRYQRAYQSAAKYLTVMDDVLNSLIGMVG